jgi:GntR family transcriptional regulator, transcriptional repressor for pyruvate dehydrogenase complex
MFAAVDRPSDYLVHDVLFHRVIAKASGNPILGAIMETVTSSMYDKRRKTVERAIDLRESADMPNRQICTGRFIARSEPESRPKRAN